MITFTPQLFRMTNSRPSFSMPVQETEKDKFHPILHSWKVTLMETDSSLPIRLPTSFIMLTKMETENKFVSLFFIFRGSFNIRRYSRGSFGHLYWWYQNCCCQSFRIRIKSKIWNLRLWQWWWISIPKFRT